MREGLGVPLRGLVLSLGFLLAACSFTVTVPLRNQEFRLQALPDTQGKILYPKDPVSFSPPPVSPKNVVLEGTLEASQPLSTSLTFYVRLEEPKAGSDCRDLEIIPAYACSPGTEDQESGKASFTNSTSDALTLRGEKLTQGIAQGRFWLGLKAEGLPSSLVTLTLKDAKARVTVGF